MKKQLYLIAAVLTVLVHFMQITSAAHNPHGTAIVFDAHDGIYAYDYKYVDSYYGSPLYRVAYGPNIYNTNYRSSYYWDDEDLKWRKDPVYEWVNKGSTWQERVKRARAINFVDYSYNARYASNSEKQSGEAFDYNFGTSNIESDWRNKDAYNPSAYGIDKTYDYYYKPRYDTQTKTWSWRY